jgi:hypothetical protein
LVDVFKQTVNLAARLGVVATDCHLGGLENFSGHLVAVLVDISDRSLGLVAFDLEHHFVALGVDSITRLGSDKRDVLGFEDIVERFERRLDTWSNIRIFILIECPDEVFSDRRKLGDNIFGRAGFHFVLLLFGSFLVVLEISPRAAELLG